jgi:hypothetical protein
MPISAFPVRKLQSGQSRVEKRGSTHFSMVIVASPSTQSIYARVIANLVESGFGQDSPDNPHLRGHYLSNNQYTLGIAL